MKGEMHMNAKRITELWDSIINNPYQRLIGDISHGYRYVDSDQLSQLERDYIESDMNELTKLYKEFSKMNSKSIHNKIKKVIFNDPATIVFWSDGKKTVVKCGERDIYDPEKGLAMAIAKRALGNEGNYYELFKKWLPKENNE